MVARSSQELVGAETVLREEVQKAVLTYFSQRRLFNEGVFQVGIDLALIQQRVIDYGSNPATFTAKLTAAVRHIHAEGNLVLEQEMKRLLPRNTTELYREAYPGIAGKVADLIEMCCLHHNEGLKG